MSSVSLSDLEFALELVHGMAPNTVYVSKKTGHIHVVPADIEAGEDVPEDLETSNEFVTLPAKQDFDLGNQLVFRFIEREAPSEYESVRNIFRHKGAYGRYKHLLESKNLLQRWSRFEEEQTQAALREWCEQNGLQVGK